MHYWLKKEIKFRNMILVVFMFIIALSSTIQHNNIISVWGWSDPIFLYCIVLIPNLLAIIAFFDRPEME